LRGEALRRDFPERVQDGTVIPIGDLGLSGSLLRVNKIGP
jgi:hypothetical protein